MHQCLKYYRGGERKINGIVKVTKAESHCTYARFLKDNDASKGIAPLTITFTGKGGMKNFLQVLKGDMPTHQLKKEEDK